MKKTGCELLLYLSGMILLLSGVSCCSEVEPLQGVGKPATAAELEFARAAVETRPTLYGYLQLSLWYHQAGEFGECIALAERSLRIDPNSALAYNNICSAYLELGEFDRAIDSCGKALAIDPSFEYARNNLKWAQVRRK